MGLIAGFLFVAPPLPDPGLCLPLSAGPGWDGLLGVLGVGVTGEGVLSGPALQLLDS